MRKLQLEVDMLGFNESSFFPPTSSYRMEDETPSEMVEEIEWVRRSDVITARTLIAHGSAVVHHELRAPLVPRSAAYRILRDAVISETKEDSDLYIVLHGYGAAGMFGSYELATGVAQTPEHVSAAVKCEAGRRPREPSGVCLRACVWQVSST